MSDYYASRAPAPADDHQCCDFHGEWCPDNAACFGACCDGCPTERAQTESEAPRG